MGSNGLVREGVGLMFEVCSLSLSYTTVRVPSIDFKCTFRAPGSSHSPAAAPSPLVSNPTESHHHQLAHRLSFPSRRCRRRVSCDSSSAPSPLSPYLSLVFASGTSSRLALSSPESRHSQLAPPLASTKAPPTPLAHHSSPLATWTDESV
ncbi:hypothetical protein GALMADRAFT_248778 [Galerina marginata CBS 339.88]|uniref:Uncharacterized protein n=1 Tax=Galerina marginata (strain CBS 339.88) TaxID=685588 RepID=A0A067T500_GALM3|nr:hypothetical protein GALMADRAFT_248778 [Galerina marginata CBS 339.88]